ncbi:MAG: hypothetical protein J1F05_01525 [Muribaculaceae bacterium]|nr:hypothetical protein [Muribaculaceae bacterium]
MATQIFLPNHGCLHIFRLNLFFTDVLFDYIDTCNAEDLQGLYSDLKNKNIALSSEVKSRCSEMIDRQTERIFYNFLADYFIYSFIAQQAEKQKALTATTKTATKSQADIIKSVSGLLSIPAQREFGLDENGNIQLAVKIVNYLSQKRNMRQTMALCYTLYSFKIVKVGYNNKKDEYALILDKPNNFTDWQKHFFKVIGKKLPPNFDKNHNYVPSRIQCFDKELESVRIALELPLVFNS